MNELLKPKMNKQISLPNVVFVYRYSEFFIGALTQLKEMGKGPGESGSGRVASGLSASSRLDMNQSESVTGHQAKLY